MNKSQAKQFFLNHAASLLTLAAAKIREGQDWTGFNVQSAVVIAETATFFHQKNEATEEEAQEFANEIFKAGFLPNGIHENFRVLTGYLYSRMNPVAQGDALRA